MQYIPLTENECRQMLESLGVSSIDDLLSDIPAAKRLKQALNLPVAMSEQNLARFMKRLASFDTPHDSIPCFMGAGSYRHFVPAAVRAMAARSEFVTAYTPYQPEISQGSLQAMFEYQTMMTQLTGMQVSNASMYDGAMATAEAALLAVRAKRCQTVMVSRALNPSYRTVLDTYTSNLDVTITELPVNSKGQTDLTPLLSLDAKNIAGVMIQSPNMLGVIEDLESIGRQLKQLKILFVVVVTEAMSLAILKAPGHCGADIVCGEGQSLGLPVNFGGPYLGFFTVTDELMRRMPGRVVGLTQDTEGRCGFVNTLSTREQHIRRDKATSNICTNQALCAITSAMYMTAMGQRGLRNVALMNMKKAAYLKSKLETVSGVSIPFDGPAFNELTVVLPASLDSFQKALAEHGIIGGYDLRCSWPELGQAMLLCVTETNTREDIDRFTVVLSEWIQEVRG
ncbi:aminomethyl-transferring glycine dehydrogenase subunit GcvPA [bacterium]|nr:aminomethyl-transferring glycine dehydrogenase subunit GcvPA [candidate division CSSED10-310 bacterium]